MLPLCSQLSQMPSKNVNVKAATMALLVGGASSKAPPSISEGRTRKCTERLYFDKAPGILQRSQRLDSDVAIRTMVVGVFTVELAYQ